MSSAKLILAVGPALGGRNWQSELADTLGINRRTIRRWLTGEDEPRPGVWIELLAIMRERHTHLGELMKAVEKMTAGANRPGSCCHPSAACHRLPVVSFGSSLPQRP